MKKNFLLLCLLMASISSAIAKDIYVSSTGNDSSGDGTTEKPYATLTKAYEKAASGDVIKISGQITINGRVHIQNSAVSDEFSITFEGTTGPEADKLVCAGGHTASVFRVERGSLTLRNLTIKDCKSAGGAINVGQNASVTTALIVDNCIFDNNISGSANNNSPSGAISIGHTSTTMTNTLTVSNTIFTNNSGYSGGAVEVRNTNATFTDCIFDSNSTNPETWNNQAFGGALFIRGDLPGNMAVSLTRCIFKNNIAAGHGGAIAMNSGGSLTSITATYQSCAFINNACGGGESNTYTSQSKADGSNLVKDCQGGAIYLSHGKPNTINFYGCTFAENISSHYGAALASVGNYNAVEGPNVVNFINCTVTANKMYGGTSSIHNGPGVYVSNTIDKDFTPKYPITTNIINSIMVDNWGYNGSSSSSTHDDFNARGLDYNTVNITNSYIGATNAYKYATSTNSYISEGYYLQAKGILTASTEGNYYLLANGSEYATKGVADDASTYTTTDQEGRTIANVIGAVQKILVNTGSEGMATFASTNAVSFEGVSGLTAYKAKVEGSVVKLTEVTEAPAVTGLILETAATSVELPVVASASISDNELVGITEDTQLAQTTDGKTNYVLSKESGSLGFYKVPSTGDKKLKAFHAYLPISDSAPARLSWSWEDDPTSISEVKSYSGIEQGTYYNLNGQQVAQPGKGLYIVNGKKVILK